MSNNEIVLDSTVLDDATISDPLKITLKTPVVFEGTEISEIDLSALENWTCDDLIKARKKYKKINAEEFSTLDAIIPEANIEYCLFIAAEVTKLPFEFFKKLPAKESNGIKAKLILFFNSEV